MAFTILEWNAESSFSEIRKSSKLPFTMSEVASSTFFASSLYISRTNLLIQRAHFSLEVGFFGMRLWVFAQLICTDVFFPSRFTLLLCCSSFWSWDYNELTLTFPRFLISASASRGVGIRARGFGRGRFFGVGSWVPAVRGGVGGEGLISFEGVALSRGLLLFEFLIPESTLILFGLCHLNENNIFYPSRHV